MNKKLLAMAAAVGFAASSTVIAAPRVGGMMQVEIANVSNDGYGENITWGNRVATGVDQSALKTTDNERGRLWIKGTESLGGSLKANYTFEWQIDTPNGNLYDEARESWIGLSGDFGEVELGRIRSPYKYTGGVIYDPFVATYMEARRSGGMIGGDFGQNSFWSNSISWKKSLGKVIVWINLGLDEGTGADSGTNSAASVKPDRAAAKGDVAASVLYKAASWQVFVAYSKDDSETNDSANNDSRDILKLGGQFTTGAHTFSIQYEMDDKVPVDADVDVLFVGYQMKFGKNLFAAQLGQTNAELTGGNIDYYSLGVIHKFTTQTRAFIGYRVSDQDDVVGVGADNKLSVISLGLRVDF